MSIIVSCNRGHNASTTLLVDGEIVFYLEEERLTRFKRDGTPLMGLAKVFDGQILLIAKHCGWPGFDCQSFR